MSDCPIIKTAGIIIIGNEILSGKVPDSNSFYLVSELRALGVSVMRISVIPDEIETIGRECSSFSSAFDYVFTSGGVGPTHDDITIAGIARGFGIRVVTHPALEKRFRTRYAASLNDSIMKMAEVPEGAEVVDFGDSRFPLVVFRNIYIFPGIPKYLREKFALIRERFRCSVIFLKKIFLDAEESEIASALNIVVAGSPGVSFGSYPVLDNPEYRIVITAESRDEEALNRAVDKILTELPKRIVVRTE